MSDQLTAIDDALETGAADHDDPLTRELQELALALRADVARAGPRVPRTARARGYEAASRSQLRLRQPLWRRALTPRIRDRARGPADRADRDPGRRLGGRRTTAVAAEADRAAAGAEDDGGGGSAIAGARAGATARARSSQRAGAIRLPPAAAPAVTLPPDGGFAPGQRNRKIERSVGLELEMPVDQMARVAEQVTTVTNRHGGFVLSSSVSTGEDSAGGDFELRIPATRLRPALRDLAALADVRTQTQTGRDVTREHVTAKDRLQAARAERRSLLRRLELAATDEEAEAIRRRLDLVAGEINGLRAQLRDLRLRTDYAVVTVSLLPKDGDEGGGAGGSFDDALGDAGDLLVGVAGVIVRALAVALPLGLIALVGWLAGRAVRAPPARVRAGLARGLRSVSSWLWPQSPPSTSRTRPAPGPTPRDPPTPGCAGASATRSSGGSS